MAQPLLNKLKAGLLGAAVVGGLAAMIGVVVPAVIQTTVASEPTVAAAFHPFPSPAGKALDTDLVRVNGDYFAVQTEPNVSLEPKSRVVIRKIGYGQTSFVTVTTTPSGTYSTDAMYSQHVRYPGVHSEELQLLVSPLGGSVLGWSSLSGWVKIPLLSADSLGYLDSDVPPASRDGVCVKDTATGACR